MKRNLFENKYEPSSAMKIVFVDIVCFLLVCIFSVGFCYSYFSDNVSISGDTAMAHVAVQYQYGATDSTYAPVSDVYGQINGGDVQKLNGATITPGDTITIVGRAVNTSSVAVYVLAKLTLVTSKGTEEVWYNIGSNDPASGESQNTSALPNTIENYGYQQLYLEDMTTSAGRTDKIYQIGAGSLAGSYVQNEVTYYYHKDLAIPYTFEGDKYENGDTITSISLTLHVHQKDHLSTASDFINLYKPHATGITETSPNGFINNYTTESIYATHHITGNLLSE